MRPFRFRADAALQLRRREHDRALVTLARAESAVLTARQAVDRAGAAWQEAGDQQRAAMVSPGGSPPVEWYRSWRLRLAGERQRCEDARTARETDAAAAQAAVNKARQRVRSLERLHDLARAAWQREADREERKAMDALAAMRFIRLREESPR